MLLTKKYYFIIILLHGVGGNWQPVYIYLYLCNSKIYCTGEILRQVQMAKLFDDNKVFVDMKLTADPGEFKKKSNLIPI